MCPTGSRSPAAIDTAPLIRALVSDLLAGAPPVPLIAARFHATMAALIAAVCRHNSPARRA